MNEGSKIFSVMVVGDEPEKLMEKYQIGLKVDKYCVYKYLDAEKMLKKSIEMLNGIIDNKDKFNFNAYQLDFLKEKIKSMSNLTPFEYYSSLTKGLYIDENGDAWSDNNPNGKWRDYQIGKNFSVPFMLINGNTSYQATNEEIAWDKMHMNNSHTYEVVWELIKEGREPQNETEKTLYENMKNKENYFNSFKNKEEYIIHNCAYWNYGYLDENGWKDMDDDNNQTKWIEEYYERFILKLKPTDKITIFECARNKEEKK